LTEIKRAAKRAAQVKRSGRRKNEREKTKHQVGKKQTSSPTDAPG